jgi:hypothetical protein
MSEGQIEVNTGELGVGVESCQYAAGSARKAADRLGEAIVPSGVFGDFAEAHSFHNAMSAAHRAHQEQLHAHHSKLMGLSDKAKTAAKAFTNIDESAADEIDAAAGEID